MSPKLQLITLASLLTVAGCLSTHNVTVPAPEGFFNHGKIGLICVPIKWYNILFFFITNYIAHAATVKSRPGQKFRHAARDFIFALVFPYSGLLRVLSSFLEFTWSKHALTKAYHAGALWVVEAYFLPYTTEDSSMSYNLQPFHQDQLSTPQVQQRTQEETSPNGRLTRLESKIRSMLYNPDPKPRSVHGVCKLPTGYRITLLDVAARIHTEKDQDPGDMVLCTSYNMPKALIAVLQAIFASITLYRSRGDQISLYGYASFGLTVIPYIIMSIMNFCAALILPEYPTVFIVLSEASDEAVAHGARIEGAVGRLVENEDGSQTPTPSTDFVKVKPHFWRQVGKVYVVIVTFIFGAIPLAVIGGLTHFKAGDSTTAQRAWTMMWLVFGIIFGPFYEVNSWPKPMKGFVREVGPLKTFINQGVGAVSFAVPAIGGFVVVGQMLKAYGSCTLFS